MKMACVLLTLWNPGVVRSDGGKMQILGFIFGNSLMIIGLSF